jgi:membrane-associated protease RseP (regulator of RpoE activity)
MATFQPISMALLYVLAFYPILYASAFLREVGHALLCRWNGWQVTSLGIGVGHPVAVWKWRGKRSPAKGRLTTFSRAE